MADLFVFRDVMDKGLVDCHGHKAGKVDDIALEVQPGRLPVVKAIVTGPGATASIFPQWMTRLAASIERFVLGRTTLEPKTVGWEHVTKIDVVVHLDVDRDQYGLIQTEQAIWQRWIRALPWSER